MAATPMRYLAEPVTYFKPFHEYDKNNNDQLARPYTAELPNNDPLVIRYNTLAAQHIDYTKILPRRVGEKVVRNDRNAELVLIKEVHSLLAAPGLVQVLNAPTVVISRNPIYVVDSLLAYQSIDVPIWRAEYNYVNDKCFLHSLYGESQADTIFQALHEYPDDGIDRTNTIMGKALTVAIISSVLKRLADTSRLVKHVAYEELCLAPMSLYQECAKHLGIEMGEQGKAFLKETLQARSGKVHPTKTVHKDSRTQSTRPMKALTETEIDMLRELLSDCQLN
ncbi:hypothetical protein [uncultured Pseudodesulfovibrio sp.]|uniref:hypothetical protein n=1 Tax=uncultured Pseudodesulfovibrio sp. TaxID=2035858 RepID=UPI0029C7A2D6|nr:hypothetical protein [uncultured Pseudodesulfovibrio sp.]